MIDPQLKTFECLQSGEKGIRFLAVDVAMHHGSSKSLFYAGPFKKIWILGPFECFFRDLVVS